ncbi:MAG: ABC transporter substrate-binding protein [Dehalococcoidia bacterium]|nr:ABC transporter substrate-binding protein [Dehalococcoidia bacterium]
MIKRLALTLVLFLAVITVLAGCSAKPPEKVGLKIGSLPRLIDLIAYVAQQEGLFEKQGVTVEIVPFRSTVEMNTTLLAGELDGIIQDLFEAVNMNRDKETVKIVGRNVMPDMFHILVPSGSNISSPAQLKGTEIAVATGTIIEYGLDELLKSAGMDSKDVTKVNVPSMPLRLEILNQGKVPAAIFTQPLTDLAVLSGARVILDDSKQPFVGPGLIFSTGALKNKSEAIRRCVQAWQQAVDLVNARPDKYQSLFIDVARVPEPLTKRLTVPAFPKLRLPTEAEVTPVVKWMADKGLINKPLRLQDIVDTSFLK